VHVHAPPLLIYLDTCDPWPGRDCLPLLNPTPIQHNHPSIHPLLNPTLIQHNHPSIHPSIHPFIHQVRRALELGVNAPKLTMEGFGGTYFMYDPRKRPLGTYVCMYVCVRLGCAYGLCCCAYVWAVRSCLPVV